ncbi:MULTISPECIES: type II toxin-antitoxin system HicB family antitoxin [Halomonadaceae]|uniref:Antitoxin HicB n=1 Tax=Vreelandella titanicae TaxID=664683 RepID=A0AAP9NM05_9GAMM|nr:MULTISPECIES: type II toxin-antitoxin system HicB family antitoxin [Halomonas]QKS24206.1 Antitoxin HicB [Halomonas titanicae]CDG54550.1 putative bacteriophage protein transcription regulator [Halomonas sp. A3H3]SDI30728.1 antitoxin HicB [Halomonas titanicae]
MRYPIKLEPDTVGFMATSRDLPEFVAADEDERSTLVNAVELLETTLGIYIDERRRVPRPSEAQDGEHLVAVPASTVIKVLLSEAMLDKGWRKADLARAMNVAPVQVDRMLDVNHKSKLAQLEAAMDAMGHHLEIEVVAA